MLTQEQMRKALQEYIESSDTNDFRPKAERLLELEQSSNAYLGKIIGQNIFEINRLEKIVISFNERLGRFEDGNRLGNRGTTIVLGKKTVLLISVLGGAGCFLAFMIAFLLLRLFGKGI
jgi:hypothetical protein